LWDQKNNGRRKQKEGGEGKSLKYSAVGNSKKKWDARGVPFIWAIQQEEINARYWIGKVKDGQKKREEAS